MGIEMKAVWHKKSWDAFLEEKLTRLLADHISVGGYRIEPVDTFSCNLHLSVQTKNKVVDVFYENLPMCDTWGCFKIAGHCRAVVPVPTEIDLEKADILCVGEQALGFLETRMGEVPEHLEDAGAIQACLPLGEWLEEFFTTEPTSQYLQRTNDVDMHTHLRRITLFPLLGVAKDATAIVHPSHEGRVCLFCTPEGPNISRIFEIALGATIENDKLVIVDDAPEKGLGVNSSMIPFLEHDDTNRALMGINMMRQWIGVPNPDVPRDEAGVWQKYFDEYDGLTPETEPALVQTGNEIDDPYFWKGYNLLTAFMNWDGDTYEDGLVISASAAQKMMQPSQVAIGDKLSNRHGTKGVISRIIPDKEMPQLEDGTHVEMIVSLCTLPSRLNMGQVREAVVGRIAKAEGSPVVVPSLRSPKDQELKDRLKANGLPEDGMEQLSLNGDKLARRTTVGWVYWGRTNHLATNKIHFSVNSSDRGQSLDETSFLALKEAGAIALVNEFYNTCSAQRTDVDSLAERIAKGPVEPAGAPSPKYDELVERLGLDGVSVSLGENGVSFATKETGDLVLAHDVPHPWLTGQVLSQIGLNDSPLSEAVKEANVRLEQMISNGAPQVLIERAVDSLAERVQAFYDDLLVPEDLRFNTRVIFSGRSVMAPNKHLNYDQIGVPEEMAWALFGPFVAREMGSDTDVKKRSKTAAKVLDEVMAKMWVVSLRPPAVAPTAFLAFHAVRVSGDAIQVPILATRVMEADYDGDQVALFLPVTEEGQKTAGECLSVAEQLARDPSLIRRGKMPLHDALFGLAYLSMSDEGMKALGEVVGKPVSRSGKFITKDWLCTLLEGALDEAGASGALDLAERLQQKGFEVAKQIGGSMGPFLGSSLTISEPPEGEDVDEWRAYVEELVGEISSQVDFEDDAFGAVAMLVECGARANWNQLRHYVAPQGLVRNASGGLEAVRHCYREGLTAKELFTRTVGARLGLANMLAEMAEVNRDLERQSAPSGYGVLARARRSEKPGVVFARAALKKEVDPLNDAYSRLFVGK